MKTLRIWTVALMACSAVYLLLALLSRDLIWPSHWSRLNADTSMLFIFLAILTYPIAVMAAALVVIRPAAQKARRQKDASQAALRDRLWTLREEADDAQFRHFGTRPKRRFTRHGPVSPAAE